MLTHVLFLVTHFLQRKKPFGNSFLCIIVFQNIFFEWKPYRANIVCFYLKLKWKQNSTENVRLGPSNQQIKLQPTILQYPLINYLALNKVNVMKWKARKGPNKQVLLKLWLLLTFFKKGINLRFRKKSWNKSMFNMWK